MATLTHNPFLAYNKYRLVILVNRTGEHSHRRVTAASEKRLERIIQTYGMDGMEIKMGRDEKMSPFRTEAEALAQLVGTHPTP